MNSFLVNSSVRNRFKVFRQIVFLILLLIILIITLMCVFSIEDNVRGDGTIVGIRDYDLKTMVTAKVIRIHRKEGDEVQRGEVLVEFDSRDQQDKIKRLENELAQLYKQLEISRGKLLLLRKDPLPDHYRHTRLQLEEARERVARTRHELEVYTDLFRRKAITRREFLRVELEHLSSQKTLERLTEDWQRLQTGIAQDIIAQAEREIKLLEKQIAAKQHEIEVARRHLDDYLLRAPDTGIVTDIPPRPGGYYERGEVVVRFSANQNKKVIAMIDERHIFKIAPGQKARIYCQQYNYLDYGYFRGKVTDIYQLPVKRGNINYYPVRIVLESEPHPLRFGSGCEVSIVTGHDRVICVVLGIRGENFWKRRGIKRQ